MCFVTVVSFVIVVCLQLNSVVGQLHAVQSTSSYVALTVLTILGEHTYLKKRILYGVWHLVV